MKAISLETRKLLDKLYNLKGKDSVILANIKEETEAAEAIKNRTEQEKKELEKTISELTTDETVLKEQGENLKTVLKSIKSSDFSMVLERLNLDFNPEELNKKVTEALPGDIELITNSKKEAENELIEVEKEMNAAIIKIEELAIRKDEAVQNQTKLNEYFKLALSGNINITRDSITALLEKFRFTEDEQREAAKLLMFPEDSLYEYEQNYKNISSTGKSISEVFAEAKIPVIEEEPLTSIKDLIKEEVKEVKPETIEIEEKTKKEEISILVKEEKVEDNKNDVKTFLEKLGLNVDEFNEQDIKSIESNFNPEVITNNVEYMNKININKDIFVDNVEFLYDVELKEKIEKLLAIGKVPFDIYLNPNILLKYNLVELTKAIETLATSGLDPKKVPLMAF